jgi:Tol biopolymer transport system component
MTKSFKIMVAMASVLLLASGVALVVSVKPAQATFSGENGKIAFTTHRDRNAEIYTMNADGAAPTRLTSDSRQDTDSAWSADGAQIAFQKGDGVTGTFEIYTMNADGSNQQNITRNSTDDYTPAWSPDGTKIVFVNYDQSTVNTDIYTVNAEGSELTRLTSDPKMDHDPAWSPDGTQIAFTRTEGNGTNDEVYVMNADGSNQTRLTNNLVNDSVPDWSPDGTKIAFTTHRDGNTEIYTMNPDGSNPVRLTNTPTEEFEPVWSPDSTKIAYRFFRTDGSGYEIYSMNADGSNQTAITNNSWHDYNPDWQPLSPDTTNPSVTLTTPTDSATRVSRTTNVTATFTKEMKADTLTTSTFKLEKVNKKGSPTAVAATVSSEVISDPTTNKQVTKATLDPTDNLGNGTYRATITTGATDKAGNALAEEKGAGPHNPGSSHTLLFPEFPRIGISGSSVSENGSSETV